MSAGQCLILGGCGFLGRHVAVLLASAGARVVLADRAAPTWDIPGDLQRCITWRQFDLACADWDTLVEDASLVYHCAWTTTPLSANNNPGGDVLANVVPTLRLLQSLRRRANGIKLVFLSSGGTVYGKLRRVPVHENHPLAPISVYGASKVAVELYCGIYRSQHGLDCRVARVSNPFGAGQNPIRGQGAVTVFLHRALLGQPVEIWGDGEVVRDYLHVSDAAAGLVALGCAPRSSGPHVFNIGSGRGVSLNGLVAELKTLLGREVDVQYRPSRPFDVPISILDVALVGEVLGWSARLSFSEGLVRTLSDVKRGTGLSTLLCAE